VIEPSRAGPVIDVVGLTKSYHKVEAVRGIDISVLRGEVFGFLGPNGAGKSTTIGILAALTDPSGGTARVAGFDVVRSPNEVRARIGIVFQEPSLDIQLTARENLEFHAFLYDVPRSERRRRIDDALEMVQLADRQHGIVRTFSGGMRRRLEIARGIIHHPQILFLDEPTLGLDPQVRSRIWTHLQDVRKREGTTLFMTTHYMDEAEFCDRIAIIDHGRIIAEGTPDQLKAGVGGDIVTLRASQPDAVAAEIERRFGVAVRTEPDELRIEVDDAAVFVPRLLRELTLPVGSITIDRPSLDDVFLKLTGHAIREAGGVMDQRMSALGARAMGGPR
jgi:ABC-2 type transport system ATP-binding protein